MDTDPAPIIWQFEHAVECHAKRSFVWRYWTDVSNWERLEGNAVAWIKLDGPFVAGTSGATKSPGQEPHYWKITKLNAERSATIEMPLDQAVFYNEMIMETISEGRTRITQRLSLRGPNASNLVDGVQMFEQSAPQGLRKLVNAIESAYISKPNL